MTVELGGSVRDENMVTSQAPFRSVGAIAGGDFGGRRRGRGERGGGFHWLGFRSE